MGCRRRGFRQQGFEPWIGFGAFGDSLGELLEDCFDLARAGDGIALAGEVCAQTVGRACRKKMSNEQGDQDRRSCIEDLMLQTSH